MATRFTVKDVEEQARLILLDTYADSYRFEPKEMHAAMVAALEKIRVERPASRYVGGVLVPLRFLTYNQYGQVSAETDSIPAVYGSTTEVDTFRASTVDMERRWLPAVVYYVVHRMYLKDDPDTSNANLAARYLEMYANALGG